MTTDDTDRFQTWTDEDHHYVIDNVPDPEDGRIVADLIVADLPSLFLAQVVASKLNGYA